jgi:hypothetical protein
MAALHPILKGLERLRGGDKSSRNTEETNSASLNSTYLCAIPKESSYMYEIPTRALVTPYDINLCCKSLETKCSFVFWSPKSN